MKADDIKRLATDPSWWPSGPWWTREAARAFLRGDFLLIPGRLDADLYVARFWLSAAVRRPSDQPSGEAIESGDSLLLHFFARPDDDGALHDHPWDFRTTILTGSYCELVPSAKWMPDIDHGLGPSLGEATSLMRTQGDIVGHRSTDLHAVESVSADTWTLVRTGPRVREWGFHPPGQRWIGYRAFLDAKKPQAVTA